MAETKYAAAAAEEVDPRSGFCWKTKTFHSLRPPAPLPPPSQPLSITDYVTSLLRTCPYPLHTTTAFIDASSGHCLSYSDFLRCSHSLAASLRRRFPSDAAPTAFILSPSSLDLSVLYFALLSLGAVVSPANPLSTAKEISHLVSLCKPHIAFSTRAAASKLPSLPLGTVLIDSPEFESMMTQPPLAAAEPGSPDQIPISVNQSDPAAILYSSGTTGRVKGVLLTHRNLVALIGGLFHNRTKRDFQVVSLLTLPLFHIFGLFMLLRTVAVGDTSVVMKRFDFEAMLRAVERYRVMYMPVSPPIVVALTKSELVRKYDLSSLLALGCGGAPLGKELAQRFTHRFPDIELSQGYGLTETGGGASGMIGPDECKRYGSVGRLIGNMEAKIVDPATGEALLPGQQGELWVRGPVIMKGYVGDGEATAATLNSDGWLKTGDLCYIDSDGFLFIVDRLKELIKYKAYQVPPAELEHLLLSNPEISDAAVIPYPDEEAGQIPMAYIVRKPSSNINESQVMDYVAKQVAPYKKIRQVVFVSSIPKSPSGKILRRELVKLALSPASARL